MTTEPIRGHPGFAPCPFCGGPARCDEERNKGSLHVYWIAACMDTLCCATSRRWPTREDAMKAWNRRGGPCTADATLLEQRASEPQGDAAALYRLWAEVYKHHSDHPDATRIADCAVRSARAVIG